MSKAAYSAEAVEMRDIPPLISKKLIPLKIRKGNINPKKADANKVVPGKGLPLQQDALLSLQKSKGSFRKSASPPSLVFEANSRSVSPSDPTGAIGPNHYVSANNSSFTIHDRSGNVIVSPTNLENISFEGENLGDPVVLYDNFADRFIITQFSNSPNGFLISISKGPDPVNSGWYAFRFNTDSFPDYPRYSIWSDGYYITANKNQNQVTSRNVVYVLEREKLLRGDQSAKIVGFPLPGASIGGFYSPTSFNVTGNTLPPTGNAKIVYFQDDAWSGVQNDILKFWNINVDWIVTDNSTIQEGETLATTPFDSTFDGASFTNLPQPGSDTNPDIIDIDVLQGAIMQNSNYRRFCDYNSVVLNFAVDIDSRPNTDDISAIRWYELRQDGDTDSNGNPQPWYIHQEGTYSSPGGKSAWCGSMAMDSQGNIGMAYTTMGTVADGADSDSFVSIRYTGRLADDASGVMTFEEQTIKEGTGVGISTSSRYGDYAHLTIDPIDDQTFWHIAEYYEGSGDNARDVVGVFKIADGSNGNDVGVISIDAPVDATLDADESVIVTLKNFGNNIVSNIPVSYTVNNGSGTPVEETFTGSINPGETVQFTFSTRVDLTTEEEFIYITAETNLGTDNVTFNDCVTKRVKNLLPNDVGVASLVDPVSGGGLTSDNPITILVQNFGGETQSNFPVYYILDNGDRIEETFTGTLAVGESAEYTFEEGADLSEFGSYSFELGTVLDNDQDTSNDTINITVLHELCTPTSDCKTAGDGISFFRLSNIENTGISCDTGYENYTDLVVNLDINKRIYLLTVQTGFASGSKEQMSMWIDYNDDAIFEESELILSNEVIKEKEVDQNFSFTLGQEATLGRHVLRIRAGDTDTNNGARLNEACRSMQFGTTHDYSVEIGRNGNPNTDLIVTTLPNDQFLITMSDSNVDNILRLSVYSIDGKTLVSNIIRKDANGGFTYELDMSFATRGIYLVRLGSSETGKSAKFIVR